MNEFEFLCGYPEIPYYLYVEPSDSTSIDIVVSSNINV